jgi:transcriptional regulator with XRE-family HTH domain
MVVGGTLRSLRRRRGLTQAEVAAAVGIPVTVLSAYERGRREPRAEVAGRIVEALGFRLQFVDAPAPQVCAERLRDALTLAEALPYRARPLAKARR